MREFLGDDFLLSTDTAVELYHGAAENMPIYDYHCHLPPQQIADNVGFESITQVWLGGDHYKWRLMRANGVSERLITGDAPDWDKFQAWSETLPYTLGNPVHQWTHLELRRYFGVNDLLVPETARKVYDRCNELLATPEFRVRELMKRMDVRVVCTTDDPADDLHYHRRIAGDRDFTVKVLPAFRPDKVFKTEDPGAFNAWIDALGAAADTDIRDYWTLLDALRQRINFFHENGARISDHGIEAPFAADFIETDVERIFLDLRSGRDVKEADAEQFRSAVFLELGHAYAEKSWTMQIHLAALRNNNSRMFELLGPDTGYDSMGDFEIGKPLVKFLDGLAKTDELPKTILYSLNPRDNEVLATIAGSFQDGSVAGKMQLGSGWWFNDQRDGMERQMTALANTGLLSRFVGMITDSRSFLSYPRHEYFRRVLCDLLGRWVENGEVPKDMQQLGQMVGDISYNNAVRYFGIDVEN